MYTYDTKKVCTNQFRAHPYCIATKYTPTVKGNLVLGGLCRSLIRETAVVTAVTQFVMLSLRPSHCYVPTSFSCNLRMKGSVFLSREIYYSATIEREEFLGWITARRKTMALEWFALTTSEVLLSCAIIVLVWLLLRLVKSRFSQKRYDPIPLARL